MPELENANGYTVSGVLWSEQNRTFVHLLGGKIENTFATYYSEPGFVENVGLPRLRTRVSKKPLT